MISPRIPTDDRRAGFSLFEVVLVMALFAGTLFTVASFRSNIDILQNLVTQKLQSRQDADVVFASLVTEVRSAGPSSLGGYAIEAASTSSLTFFSDIDGDSTFERVRYFLASATTTTTTLRKGIVEPSGNPLVYTTSTEVITTVVDNVINTSTQPLFQYYNASYTGSESAMTSTVDVTPIRLVKVGLWADINPKSSPAPIFFGNMINIRNLRSN